MTDELDHIRDLRPSVSPPSRQLVETERNRLMSIIDRETQHEPKKPRRARRRLAVGAAAAVVGLSGGAIAYAVLDGRSGTSDHLMCVASDEHDLVVGFDPRVDDPVSVCAAEWPAVFDTPAPRLTACVEPSTQGAIAVYPGTAEVCEQHGGVLYEGPTDEQLRFAAFREALAQRTEGRSCMTPTELRGLIEVLLEDHGLRGWRIGRPLGEEPACADVQGFNEPEKLIILN